MKYHYTYRITNIQIRKHYYGTRSSTKKPVDDLGIWYFSSSADIKFIQDQKDNPDHYRYKVIRVFETREEAIKFEIRLHDRYNVGINDSFYNRAKQTSIGFDTSGCSYYQMTDAHREIVRKTHTGKTVSAETRKRISQAAKSRPPVTNETRKKLSNACSGVKNGFYGKTHSEDTKQRLRNVDHSGKKNSMYGQSHSTITKELFSKQRKGRKWFNDGNKRYYIFPDDPKLPKLKLRKGYKLVAN